MNFEEALLWTILTVMIGIFLFIFYQLNKYQVDDKKESDSEEKKLRPGSLPALWEHLPLLLM